MPLKIGRKVNYLGEFCSKCGEARYLHPEVYVYTCPYCRYSFRINPVERSKHITILNKGERRDKK